MMSELHLELTELSEAGINLTDTGEAYSAACNRDTELAAACIRHYPSDYLDFAKSWFNVDCLEGVACA